MVVLGWEGMLGIAPVGHLNNSWAAATEETEQHEDSGMRLLITTIPIEEHRFYCAHQGPISFVSQWSILKSWCLYKLFCTLQRMWQTGLQLLNTQWIMYDSWMSLQLMREVKVEVTSTMCSAMTLFMLKSGSSQDVGVFFFVGLNLSKQGMAGQVIFPEKASLLLSQSANIGVVLLWRTNIWTFPKGLWYLMPPAQVKLKNETDYVYFAYIQHPIPAAHMKYVTQYMTWRKTNCQ